jgi:hypothetical protein
MRVFSCSHCGQIVYFENVVCKNCRTALGFDPQRLAMRTLHPADSGNLVTQGSGAPKTYCANHRDHVCNWLVPVAANGGLCLSCDLNHTIPDLSVSGNVAKWFEVEKAKRRLIYTLLKLNLPLTQDPDGTNSPALSFDILADAMTGHENGHITLNVAEADAATRERVRTQMDEPYRTLLGHFRHESGHYYWLVLVAGSRELDRFRKLFGDERADYGQALAAYHANGPKPNWDQNYISAYATAHPWEDWAESWAHYLHMVDALETANDYALEARMPNERWTTKVWFGSADPASAGSARRLIDRWIPLALAINSLNRSMGLNDFYPFVVSPTAATKLEFIHRLVKSQRR